MNRTELLYNFLKKHRTVIQLALLLIPIFYFANIILELTKNSPEPLEYTDHARRFGIETKKRKAIFQQLVLESPKWQKRSKNRFPNLRWRQEDDYHWAEKRFVHQLANQHGIHYSQVYMILDEGTRNHWQGPDGKMLPVSTVPLQKN